MKQFLILLAVCLCPVAATAQEPAAIQDAMACYDYEDAIRLIDGEAPSSQLLLLKAGAFKGLFRYSEAIEALQTLEEAEPGNVRVLSELSECNRLAGNLKQALKCYEKLLELNPGNSHARLQHLNLLYLMERYPETIAACGEMLERDSSAIVLRLLAQSYHNTMRPDSAAMYYIKAIEKAPDDYISVARLSTIYNTNERYAEAIELTENYRQKRKDNLFVNRQNAQAYCLNLDYDKAVERYESLVESGDRSQLTCYYLGVCYFVVERLYDAEEYLRMAYEQAPTNTNAIYYLGRACARTSWKEEGVELLQLAINLTIPANENLAILYGGLAECHFHNEDFQGQIAAIKEQYKYQPQNSSLYRIGCIYQDKLKDNQNARKYLEMFLKNKPESNAPAEAIMEGGEVIAGSESMYKTAEKRLQAIKEERFWKGQNDTKGK